MTRDETINHVVGLEDAADETHAFITELVDTFGPRLPCSDAERACAAHLEEWLAPFCDEVHTEEFTCSPNAFLGSIPLAAYISIGTVVFFYLFPLLATLFGVVGLGVFFIQFVFYKEVLDPLYPKGKSQNVVGVIRPEGEIKRRIIIAGHHDSAYEFRWIAVQNLLYFPGAILAIASLIVMALLSLIVTISYYVTGVLPEWTMSGQIFAIYCLLPIAWAGAFFRKYGVPGAGDNLSAVTTAFMVGKWVGEAKKAGHPVLKNTELHVMSFGSEEAGLRGSRAYVKAHLPELQDGITEALNIESIYKRDEIRMILLDLNGTVKTDAEMADRVKASGKKIGLEIKNFYITIPMGATDGASFSQHGIPATTLFGIPMSEKGMVPYYHTMRDTPAEVEVEALDRAVQIVAQYLLDRDADA